MFKIFRRRRDKPSLMYGVFQKMGNSIEQRQRRITDYLNRKAKRLSKKQMIIGLVMFCFLFSCGAVLVVVQAFFEPGDVVFIQPISVPQHTIEPNALNQKETWLSKDEIQSILSLQKYLDSLKSTVSGVAIYDSISRSRPGLLDTLAFIQRYYNKQLNSK